LKLVQRSVYSVLTLKLHSEAQPEWTPEGRRQRVKKKSKLEDEGKMNITNQNV
jgi:hypothetical protein